jgi:predicted dinucleotide-binding enzyme
MKYGTIGAGTIAQALARHLIGAGYPVTLSNSRGPDTLTDLITDMGPLATAGTVAQAAKADIVFLAVPFLAIPAALDGLPDWGGRILVDTTNVLAFTNSGRPELLDLGDQTGSEITAAHAPGARVIKAFNTLYARYIAPDPRHAAGRQGRVLRRRRHRGQGHRWRAARPDRFRPSGYRRSARGRAPHGRQRWTAIGPAHPQTRLTPAPPSGSANDQRTQEDTPVTKLAELVASALQPARARRSEPRVGGDRKAFG